ncbi:MAG: glycerol-3-phosphate 1-O-acyltransferase PlsY [Bacilli bacterium]
MTEILKFGLLIIAYLLGSIPFGYLIGKLRGIDIREHGSKNIGATNIGRVLGFKFAFLAFFLDLLKGALIVFLFRFSIIPQNYCWLSPMTYGLAAVLGHSFSIFINFKGGKAVATTAGVLLGFSPWVFLVGFLVFVTLVIVTKLVSLSSLISSSLTLVVAFVLYFIGFDPLFRLSVDFYFPLLHFVIFLIIVFRHRDNIVRLIKHQEQPFSFKK